jgi:hypothetical protein
MNKYNNHLCAHALLSVKFRIKESILQNMIFTTNDYIGFAGVLILLIAFLLNIAGKLLKDNLLYILMNVFGAALACFASYLIHYMPFVILEGTWTLVSLFALVKYRGKKK